MPSMGFQEHVGTAEEQRPDAHREVLVAERAPHGGTARRHAEHPPDGNHLCGRERHQPLLILLFPSAHIAFRQPAQHLR